MRYWDDFREGDKFDCGTHQISMQEIAEFAQKFDPQPFHCDEAAGASSVYGGVVASGFHTLSLCNRMAHDAFLNDTAVMGSTALDEVRWSMAVRPGDALTLRVHVVQKAASRSKPDRGIVRFRYELANARLQQVATMTVTEVVRRRELA